MLARTLLTLLFVGIAGAVPAAAEPMLPARASDGILVRYATPGAAAQRPTSPPVPAASERRRNDFVRSATFPPAHHPIRRWIHPGTALLSLPEASPARAGSREPRLADSDQARIAAALQQLRQHPDVLWAEPNYRGQFAEVPPAAAPNDPRYGEQWALASIGAPSLWAITQGAGVRVAVIDTGIDPYHPDLGGRIAPASRSVADASGAINDWIGHGTGVAGLIAAGHNDAVGIAGLTPAAELLVVKVNSGGEDSFTSAHLAEAIDFAVSNGAAVINLSLTATPTQTVSEAISRALDAGRVVVAAAGNHRGAVEFPASMPGVLGIAGHTSTGQRVTASNFGAGVALAAPGENILTTDLAGGYRWRSGTSFAAPLVSAAAAAMLAIQPGLTPAEVATWLRQHSQPMAAATDGAAADEFGRLAAGSSSQALLPALQAPGPRQTRGSPLQLSLYLPPTPRAADLYLAITTPDGRWFNLQADGQWREGTASPGTPLIATVSGYQQGGSQQLTLFGNNGLWPAIVTDSAPAGHYQLLAVLVAADSGLLLGVVQSNRLELVP